MQVSHCFSLKHHGQDFFITKNVCGSCSLTNRSESYHINDAAHDDDDNYNPYTMEILCSSKDMSQTLKQYEMLQRTVRHSTNSNSAMIHLAGLITSYTKPCVHS